MLEVSCNFLTANYADEYIENVQPFMLRQLELMKLTFINKMFFAQPQTLAQLMNRACTLTVETIDLPLL